MVLCFLGWDTPFIQGRENASEVLDYTKIFVGTLGQTLGHSSFKLFFQQMVPLLGTQDFRGSRSCDQDILAWRLKNGGMRKLITIFVANTIEIEESRLGLRGGCVCWACLWSIWDILVYVSYGIRALVD